MLKGDLKASFVRYLNKEFLTRWKSEMYQRRRYVMRPCITFLK